MENMLQTIAFGTLLTGHTSRSCRRASKIHRSRKGAIALEIPASAPGPTSARGRARGRHHASSPAPTPGLALVPAHGSSPVLDPSLAPVSTAAVCNTEASSKALYMCTCCTCRRPLDMTRRHLWATLLEPGPLGPCAWLLDVRT